MSEEILEVLSYFDRDGSKSIHISQVGKALRCCGHLVSVAEQKQIEEEAKDKLVDMEFLPFMDFVNIANQMENQAKSIEEIEDILSTFDIGNGEANEEELRRILTSLQEPLSKKQVDDLFGDSDPSAELVNLATLSHLLHNSQATTGGIST